ncbi:hypothetical protein DPMN_022129 [Dreissena polymorpha]|uniref:Uncharacterized protein n=1 Tax=Dreissena polymorpha TaxID=45954 RepID=A0A9D4NJT1_DREPO|nr:hypothetical protein DPMN_022129 [Dreissena polymorpha]
MSVTEEYYDYVKSKDAIIHYHQGDQPLPLSPGRPTSAIITRATNLCHYHQGDQPLTLPPGRPTSAQRHYG